jgi:hypothetical protein
MNKIVSGMVYKWRKFARVIGEFQAYIFFSVFYLVILFLPGVIARFLVDPLDIKKSKKSQFIDWQYKPDTLQSARKPF